MREESIPDEAKIPPRIPTRRDRSVGRDSRYSVASTPKPAKSYLEEAIEN